MSKEYDDYIKEHMDNVSKAYAWLATNVPDLVPYSREENINLCWHDASKYQIDEYEAYDNYFYIKKDNRSSAVQEEFDRAFLFHIHRNKHHWQHWVLIHDEGNLEAFEMPRKYAIEMICDWMSFSIKIGDMREVLTWYKEHKDRMVLHKNTRKLIEDIIERIDEVTKNGHKNSQST